MFWNLSINLLRDRLIIGYLINSERILISPLKPALPKDTYPFLSRYRAVYSKCLEMMSR